MGKIIELRDALDEFYAKMHAPAPASGVQSPPRAGVRPHPSDALAVHPGQVAEAVESAKRKGVPTEFLPDGRPIMRSRAHQKAYLKAYGFHNKDGSYGD